MARTKATTSAAKATEGRLFGYGRVSTADQTAANQLKELTDAGYDIKPARWFTDVISGGIPAMERPEFARLVDRLEEGDSLIVAKLDRLGRNAIDVQMTVRMLSERGVRVYVLPLGDTDLTSQGGKMLVMMLAAVAEMERDLLRERTAAGLARVKAEGKTLGRPVKTTDSQKAEMRAAYAAGGVSLAGLAAQYGVSRATVHSIVSA